jgi:hypothetical protein
MPMKPVSRVGIVVAGYVAAVLIALLVVRIYIGLTSGPSRDASSGMFAFGDMIAFLATFGLAAVLPTGAALYFLRSRPGFWVPLGVIALIVAATSLGALVIQLASTAPGPGLPEPALPALAMLRILLAPLCALAFFLAGILAPVRRARLALLIAAAIEVAVFTVIVFTWVLNSARP